MASLVDVDVKMYVIILYATLAGMVVLDQFALCIG